jgi:hypothetical protein
MEYLNENGCSFRYMNENNEKLPEETKFKLIRENKNFPPGTFSPIFFAVLKENDAYKLVNHWNNPQVTGSSSWHYWIERV